MKTFLSHLSVGRKLSLIVALAIAAIVVLEAFSLASLRESLLEDRYIKTQQLTKSASSVVVYFSDQSKKGLLTEEEAKTQALAALKSMSGGEEAYFWINDMQPVVLMHPKSAQLVGEDVSNLTDPNGTQIFVEMVKAVRQGGEGFVEYQWNKPGFSEPVDKISYVKGFKPWGWVVGTGIYLDDVDAIYQEKMIGSITVVLIILFIVAGVSFVVARNIVQPLNEIKAHMIEVQNTGNLDQKVSIDSRDELGQIALAFNGMLVSFSDMIREITDTATHLSSSAEELSAVTFQTNNGMQKQQSDSAQIATAVNEMVATVEEVARNAQSAAEAAKTAHVEVSNGKKVVTENRDAVSTLTSDIERATQVIHELRVESDNIGGILDAIGGIADQTNLLALNAAIEAARAGEQGRGFAVVADEVRTLAQRTQESTNEIQVLIERLQGKAGVAVEVMQASCEGAATSVERANQVSDSLDAIWQAIDTINDMNAQIASASEQQSAVASEIDRNILAIAQVTEETAQGSAQTASSSENLAERAGSLKVLVGKFKVAS